MALGFALPLGLWVIIDSKKREDRRDAAVIKKLHELRVLERELKDLIEIKKGVLHDQK